MLESVGHLRCNGNPIKKSAIENVRMSCANMPRLRTMFLYDEDVGMLLEDR